MGARLGELIAVGGSGKSEARSGFMRATPPRGAVETLRKVVARRTARPPTM